MTQTVAQVDQSKKNATIEQDEIELIDILRVVWKWKYLIIGGTVFGAIVALVISLVMPKIYRIDAVIRPGILSIGQEGENTYIDSAQNIKALIETGIFENEILNRLSGKIENGDIPNEVKFKVKLPKNTSTIKVGYESAQIEQGVEILNQLGAILKEQYRDLVKYYQNGFNRDVTLKRAEIQKIETIIKSTEINVSNIDKRIHELIKEITAINENTVILNNEREKFLSRDKNESSILSAILYSNTIQQNLKLTNDYKNEIKISKFEKETEFQKISELKNKLQIQLAEIDNLEFKKNNIQNIQIVREPSVSPHPIKPKKKTNIVLASLAGFFIMIFLCFLLEYISQKNSPIEIGSSRNWENP